MRAVRFIGSSGANYNELLYSEVLQPDTIHFHTGNLGIGMLPCVVEDEYLFKVDKALAKMNSVLYAVRGTQEDPGRFNEIPREEESRLFLVLDYSVIVLDNGRTVMLVGGGVPVDRAVRTLEKNYWLATPFKLKEEKAKKVDFLVVHKAPSAAPPHSFNNDTKQWFSVDSGLAATLEMERGLINDLVTLVNPSKVVYGHYSTSYNDHIDGTDYIGLNVNQTYDLIL